MHIKRTHSWEIPEHLATPEGIFLDRRRLLGGAAGLAAASLIGTLEGSGLMAEMTARLASDPDLAERYAAEHARYLEAREAIGHVSEIEGISAGGMPDRVKCLHVLAGQSLAQGRGVNPLGDEVLDRLGEFWAAGPCVSAAGAE